MHRHLQKMNEHTFDKIFSQKIGFQLFKEFCNSLCDEPVPQLKFYEEVKTNLTRNKQTKQQLEI